MDYITCPNCERTITDTYSSCPYCSKSLSKVNAPIPPAVNASKVVSKTQLMHLVLASVVFFVGFYKLFMGAIFSGLFMIFVGAWWFIIARFIIFWRNLLK